MEVDLITRTYELIKLLPDRPNNWSLFIHRESEWGAYDEWEWDICYLIHDQGGAIVRIPKRGQLWT